MGGSYDLGFRVVIPSFAVGYCMQCWWPGVIVQWHFLSLLFLHFLICDSKRAIRPVTQPFFLGKRTISPIPLAVMKTARWEQKYGRGDGNVY